MSPVEKFRESLQHAITAATVAEVAEEQLHGALPLSGGLAVVGDAHLYGALGGVIAGTILWMNTRTEVTEAT